MSNTPQMMKLHTRCKSMAKQGLVDLKISIVNVDSDTTAEAVAAEVNAIYDALEHGQCKPLNFKDSRRAA